MKLRRMVGALVDATWVARGKTKAQLAKYLYPNTNVYAVLPTADACGGVKAAHMLVNLLNRNGIHSRVVTADGLSASWLINPAPTIRLDYLKNNCKASDLIIFYWFDQLKELSSLPGRLVYYAHDCFQKLEPVPRTTFWAVGSRVREFVQNSIGSDPHIVGNWIDGQIFYPSHKLPNTVGYFPRRGKHFIDALMNDYSQLKFIRLEGPEWFVARKMRKCEYFLFPSQGNRLPDGGWSGEALPFPPAEAMMCGCKVVGFDAIGGREYMRDGYNCLIARNGDGDHLSTRLREALQNPMHDIVANAFEISKYFAPLKCLNQILNAAGIDNDSAQSLSPAQANK
jgi:glycosyltransferase involved in cell wall biosynthesis